MGAAKPLLRTKGKWKRALMNERGESSGLSLNRREKGQWLEHRPEVRTGSYSCLGLAREISDRSLNDCFEKGDGSHVPPNKNFMPLVSVKHLKLQMQRC